MGLQIFFSNCVCLFIWVVGFIFVLQTRFSYLFFCLKSSCTQLLSMVCKAIRGLAPAFPLAIHPTKICALDSSNDLQLHECKKLSDTNRNASARMHFLPQQPGNFQAPRIQLQQPLQGSVTEGSVHSSGVRVPDSSLSSAIYQLHLPADLN